MNKDTVKSIISLLLAFSPLLFLGYFHHDDHFVEKYKDLLLATSIPGFLYFIRYQIIRPIVKNEVMKPLAKILSLCARAISGEKDALERLRILGEKILEE